ncbi:alpha/beta hydrolase [Alteromonas sp. RW2A1]|uniref:alpha/beta hydrolase n=1 Tax=Alteromonas sp. RW2A1 TaxID=1917158 RepID=UPI0009FB8B44|nr:alpha/beta fold hydrolase [Alteromonas sp. RW2A1]
MSQLLDNNKSGRWSVALLLTPLIISCHSFDDARFEASEQPFPTQVAPFDDYLAQVGSYLRNNRDFISEDEGAELAMNMPFECGSSISKKGLFLVHGLGDSPYFFKEVANTLCDSGLRVRVILLPGHGSKPGDMLNVSYEQWQTETDFQLNQFAETVEQLFVGGFSTGANLTTISAFGRDDIKGMVHFSPAFKSRFFVSQLAPYIDSLYPWPNVEDEDNPSRYNSTAMPGFAAYQESVNELQRRFDTNDNEASTLNIPVLMMVAEKDSVVDTEHVASRFYENFTHPKKCMLWQGEKLPVAASIVNTNNPPHVVIQSMNLPEKRISAASHMSALFSESNDLYGRLEGNKAHQSRSIRICDNGQDSELEARCRAGEDVWFGPWGYSDENAKSDRVYARLTYTPYFDVMIDNILALTNSAPSDEFCAAP